MHLETLVFGFELFDLLIDLLFLFGGRAIDLVRISLPCGHSGFRSLDGRLVGRGAFGFAQIQLGADQRQPCRTLPPIDGPAIVSIEPTDFVAACGNRAVRLREFPPNLLRFAGCQFPVDRHLLRRAIRAATVEPLDDNGPFWRGFRFDSVIVNPHGAIAGKIERTGAAGPNQLPPQPAVIRFHFGLGLGKQHRRALLQLLKLRWFRSIPFAASNFPQECFWRNTGIFGQHLEFAQRQGPERLQAMVQHERQQPDNHRQRGSQSAAGQPHQRRTMGRKRGECAMTVAASAGGQCGHFGGCRNPWRRFPFCQWRSRRRESLDRKPSLADGERFQSS